MKPITIMAQNLYIHSESPTFSHNWSQIFVLDESGFSPSPRAISFHPPREGFAELELEVNQAGGVP